MIVVYHVLSSPLEEYLCTMFRFTDKEDRVEVGVYDVILKPREIHANYG